MPFHFHGGTELVFVVDGRCRVEVPEERFFGEAGPGDCFVIPARRPHNQINLRRTRTIYAVLKGMPARIDRPARIFSAGHDSLVHRWIEDLCRLTESPSPKHKGAVNGISRALFEVIQTQVPSFGTATRPVIDDAIEFLDDHLDMKITIPELAARFGLSASRFSALFRAQTGASPLRYLVARRMERARDLLRNDYWSVSEVAARCGFDDVNYFVRLFRREHGAPPGRWRRPRSIGSRSGRSA